MEIMALNRQLEANSEEIESLIVELIEREEFLCTGDACVGQVVGL